MFAALSPLLAVVSATPDPHPGMILPFVLLLAAIATGPFLNKHWWEQHFHHVALGLGLDHDALLCARAERAGPDAARRPRIRQLHRTGWLAVRRGGRHPHPREGRGDA